MSKFEAIFTKIVDDISRVAVYAAAATVPCWTGLFMVYIIVRKSGIASWMFVEEYTGLWLATITCLALAYTLRVGGHISIDIVSQRLPKRVNDIVGVLVTLLALGTVGIFTQHGVHHLVFAFTENVHGMTGTMALLWPFYLWVPLGYGLLGLALLLHLYHSVMELLRECKGN